VLLLVLSGIRQVLILRAERRKVNWKALGLGFRAIGRALKEASVVMMPACAACACAGVIIGTLGVTQVGIKMSDGLIAIAGNSLFVILLLSAIACTILGMGMSSIPVYIMVVITLAPALERFGVAPMTAHFFVFWFAIASFITPPVAIGAYVAASLADANPMRTGYVAMKLGIANYVLPFLFVYSPALLLKGPLEHIFLDVLTALVGITLLSWGIIGESFFGKLVQSSEHS